MWLSRKASSWSPETTCFPKTFLSVTPRLPGVKVRWIPTAQRVISDSVCHLIRKPVVKTANLGLLSENWLKQVLLLVDATATAQRKWTESASSARTLIWWCNRQAIKICWNLTVFNRRWSPSARSTARTGSVRSVSETLKYQDSTRIHPTSARNTTTTQYNTSMNTKTPFINTSSPKTGPSATCKFPFAPSKMENSTVPSVVKDMKLTPELHLELMSVVLSEIIKIDL